MPQRVRSSETVTLSVGFERQNGRIPKKPTYLMAMVACYMGLIFVGVGVGTALHLIPPPKPGTTVDPSFSLMQCIMGVPWLVVGYCLAAFRNELILNPFEQSWYGVRRILPWSKRVQGHYSELEGLRFRQETVVYGRSKQTFTVWRTRVVWKDRSLPTYIVPGLERECTDTDRSSALADAKAFAAKVGLSLTES